MQSGLPVHHPQPPPSPLLLLSSFFPRAAGEAGLELVENMDKYVSGFISGFERRYSRLERAVKTTISRTLLPSPYKKKVAAAAAAQQQQKEKQQPQRKKAQAAA